MKASLATTWHLRKAFAVLLPTVRSVGVMGDHRTPNGFPLKQLNWMFVGGFPDFLYFFFEMTHKRTTFLYIRESP